MEPLQALTGNSYETDSSTSGEDSDDSIYFPEDKKLKLQDDDYRRNKITERHPELRLPTRQPKCFTKNAVMARQNRLKKKKYMQDLESQVNKLRYENKSLSAILNNQSTLITELRKELRYMRSVLANSSDISKLLRLINNNTGMSVSTSLNKSMSLTSNCFSKNEPQHPWAEAIDPNDSLLIPDLDLGLVYENLDDAAVERRENDTQLNLLNTPLKEHNYTATNCSDENAGVCLHVSKHRVSLEFCAKCSDNAIDNWNLINEGR
ncbi:hypothetical protein AMK59_8153 [Oryctes borbonicus]|uniref:BZIP domain-containing protein n=1 Tax=Oryctes borbonicus TaxID=1629725 RepID=A0A0T6AT17_9SCAR|nr:hypothetical protein AMK59_8153 [Oryctes borbonicus]